MGRRPKYGSWGGAWCVEAAKVAEELDVLAIRKAQPGRLTQEAFAKLYGFSWASVREWEQKRRTPGRAARILLTLIQREPDAVRRALSAK